jgi:rhodanese-related sulfurtransferase/thioredoxin-related protein
MCDSSVHCLKSTFAAKYKMNKSPIAALIFTTLLAGVSSAAEVQRPEPPAATDVVTASADLQTPLTALQSHTTELVWVTDLQKAQARAKAEGKSVLLFFHGSDWCPTCAEMQRQVFDSPAFAQYARQALVLVDVDFPEKLKQDEGLRRANVALKTRFNLSPEPGESFPTIVLLNDTGETVFQETGYAGGGPAEVLPKLQRHAGAGASTAGSAAFKNLSVDEFARMAADKRNVILDVRTAKEFEAGHLPGAMNLDVNAPDFQEKAVSLDKSKTYLVHCATGVRSAKACEKLGGLDFPRLYNLPGGFKAWAKAGKPIEK